MRRVIKLPVSAPFHCDLMAPAAVVMEEALAATNLGDAAIPVYCNVTAAAETNALKLREKSCDTGHCPRALARVIDCDE